MSETNIEGIQPAECFLASLTDIRLRLVSMEGLMTSDDLSGQLGTRNNKLIDVLAIVLAGETLSTAWPLTHKRSLFGVRPEMA